MKKRPWVRRTKYSKRVPLPRETVRKIKEKALEDYKNGSLKTLRDFQRRLSSDLGKAMDEEEKKQKAKK